MSDNNKPPASKRRRTEEFDDWDDEELDFQLSQAAAENVASVEPASHNITSHTARGGTYVRPSASSDPTKRQVSSGSSQGPGGLVFSAPSSLNTSTGQNTFVKPSPLNKSGSGSSFSSSVSNGFSSDSYPSRLSSYSSRSSSSLRSSSSEEIPLTVRRPSSEKVDGSNSSSAVAVGMQEEIERCKREYQILKQQCDKVKEEMCGRDGEVKILRQKLQEKEKEVNVIKDEKIKVIERHNKEQSEKERNLQSAVEKLQTQLQFKEQDIVELRERCHSLDSRLQAAGDAPTPSQFSASIPFTSTQRPVPVSPKIIKVERSPKRKSSFPTQHSFMGDDRSAGARAPLPEAVRSTRDAATLVQMGETSKGDSKRHRHHITATDTPGGKLSGAQLIANLIESESCGTDRGLVSLLQSQSAVVDLQAFRFDRDSSNLLSPVPNKRLRDVKATLSTSDRVEVKPVSDPENHAAALQAMQQLLNNCDAVRDSALPGTRGPAQRAISFLPLLNDYLSQYVDMLNYAVDKPNTGTSPQSSSSKGSSSMDSSLESLSSSVNLMLRDCAMFANNLESLTLVALKILVKLVSYCEDVRNILLKGEQENLLTSTSSSTIDKSDRRQDSSSDTDTDQSLLSTRQSLKDLTVMKKVFRLANPGQGNQRYSSQVVIKALDVLIVMSNNIKEEDIEGLLPVLQSGVLINCLECDADVNIMLRGITLMTSLVKFNAFVSQLCVNPDGCLLSVLYQTSVCNLEHFSHQQICCTSQKVIECLHNIVSVHKGGVIILLESNCRCSIQVVKCLVSVLHKVLQLYEGSPSQESLSILRCGLLILHLLSIRDVQFSDHHYPVEHQYVRLICGLTTIFKQQANNEHEINALSDLWNFDQDDSEFSQESDDDDMDTS